MSLGLFCILCSCSRLERPAGVGPERSPGFFSEAASLSRSPRRILTVTTCYLIVAKPQLDILPSSIRVFKGNGDGPSDTQLIETGGDPIDISRRRSER